MLNASEEPDKLARLCRRAGRGDHDSQRELVRALQDTLYRFCHAQLGDAALAEDATQETALRLLGSFSKFRGDSRVSTWALGIALNVCREFRRHESRHRSKQMQADEALEIASQESEPPAIAEKRELAVRARALLNGLSERQQEAIVLRYFEERTLEETASVMNCAVGTVKATIWQALRNLRDKWDADR